MTSSFSSFVSVSLSPWKFPSLSHPTEHRLGIICSLGRVVPKIPWLQFLGLLDVEAPQDFCWQQLSRSALTGNPETF